MKKVFTEIMEIFKGACVTNTVLITLLYTIGKLISTGNGKAWIPHYRMMWIVLGISLAFSLAERFLKGNKGSALRVFGHFGICLLGFVLIFVIGGGYSKNSRQLFIAIVMFMVAYLLIMGTRLLVGSMIDRKKNNSKEYSSMFYSSKK